jgi:hypothetical protein
LVEINDGEKLEYLFFGKASGVIIVTIKTHFSSRKKKKGIVRPKFVIFLKIGLVPKLSVFEYFRFELWAR